MRFILNSITILSAFFLSNIFTFFNLFVIQREITPIHKNVQCIESFDRFLLQVELIQLVWSSYKTKNGLHQIALVFVSIHTNNFILLIQ